MLLSIEKNVEASLAEVLQVELEGKLTKKWAKSEIEGMDVQNLKIKS